MHCTYVHVYIFMSYLAGCPEIKDTDHLFHNGSTLAIGTILSFTCDEGFLLSRDSGLLCGPEGKWNDTQPFCSSPGIGLLWRGFTENY